MEVFHDTTEPDPCMTQTSCDLQRAPPTRHAVLNEELTDSGFIPEVCQPTGSVLRHMMFPAGNPWEQEGNIHMLDNPRAEVSLLTTEQDDTSLADRFPRGGLSFTVGHLHGGRAMEEESMQAEDKLDETRSNEAHPRHVYHQQEPWQTQGPCPSKPFEGLEQCLSWRQQVWAYMPRGCPCHRRMGGNSLFEEQPQQQVVDRYASHRGYPILKPPHTTKQALTRVRDRVQDQSPYHSIDRHPEEYRNTGWLTYMRDIAFPTSPLGMMSGAPRGRHTGIDHIERFSQTGRPSTYLASRPLLGRDGQDSEGTPGNRARTGNPRDRCEPDNARDIRPWR